MKKNQMLETLGFGIEEMNEDRITYCIAYNDKEGNAIDFISVVSDLSSASIWNAKKVIKSVEGPVDCINLISEFYAKRNKKYIGL